MKPVHASCLSFVLLASCVAPAGNGGTPDDESTGGGSSSESGGSSSTGGNDGGSTGGGTSQTGGSDGAGGTTGAGGNTGATGCAQASIECDDFERGSIDTAAWATVGAAPVYDTTKGHSGTSSVRFDDEGNVGRFLKHTSGFPEGGQLFFRAYMNFEKATVDMAGHTGFIVGAEGDTNSNELRFGQSSPGCVAPNQLLDLNHIPSDKTLCSSGFVSGGNPADAPDPDGTTLEADKWYCVETYWDKSVGEFRIWIDGTEVEELHAKTDNWCMEGGSDCTAPNPWPMDFQMVKFGTQVYNGGAGSIWYDDIALSTLPIGCD